MPIVSASNGIRPEIRALAVIELNKPVTPAQINACVGTGDYAAKYISFLRNRYGFTFTVQKDGRQVVSYTCVGEPKNVADLRGQKPKSKAPKMPKLTAKQISKQVGMVVARNNGGVTLKPAAKVIAKAAAAKKPAKPDPVAKVLGSTGEIAKSFTVDNDWDSMEGVDVKDFLR